MKEQKKGKCKIPNSKGTMQSSGVTLIALIITIIILLILAMTSVALIMRWNIIEKTEMAAEGYQGVSEKDAIELGYDEYALDKSTGKEDATLTVDGADVTKKEEGSGWTVKFKNSGNVYTVDENGNITGPTTGDGGSGDGEMQGDQGTEETGPKVTVEGQDQPVTLTEENVKYYLGRVVKDFKTDEIGDTETVTGVTVSTKYRLYWVDFDNKYGEGKGTIYLKADCTSNGYALETDEAEDTEPNVKIKKLNPELYNAVVGAPDANNVNMQAVTWLLNTDNWESLKKTVRNTYQDSVKYIVGTPTLEMMMDSYNTCYDLLTEETPYKETIQESERKRLFYKYPYDESKKYGYGVGPSNVSKAIDGYCTYSSDYAVQSVQEGEPNVGTMYYPGKDNGYWLASPSDESLNRVLLVGSGAGGYISNNLWKPGSSTAFNALCPVVCLKSSVHLNLEQGTQAAE